MGFVATKDGDKILIVDGGEKLYPLGEINVEIRTTEIVIFHQGEEKHRAKLAEAVPNDKAGWDALGVFAPSFSINQAGSGLASDSNQVLEINELTAIKSLLQNPLSVTVTNPTDLATVEAVLNNILTESQAINANTDQVESLISDVIAEIQAGSGANTTKLNEVIAELQKVDANTENQEIQLADIITSVQAAATELTLQTVVARLDTLIAGQSSGGGGRLSLRGNTQVSNEKVLADLKMTGTDLPSFFDTFTAGGGTAVYNAQRAAVDMTVPASAGAIVIRQTFQRFAYQAGREQNFNKTYYNFHLQTDVVKRIGAFFASYTAPHNTARVGPWIEANGVDNKYYLVIGDGITERKAEFIDILDGLGPSGISISTWEDNRFSDLNFLHLGVGPVEMRQLVGRLSILCAEIFSDQGLQGAWVFDPSLPFRCEIESFGGAGTFAHICTKISTEAGNEDLLGIPICLDGSEDLQVNDSGDYYAAYLIRLKPGRYSRLKFISVSGVPETNDDVAIYWIKNPVIGATTGGGVVYQDLGPESAFEVATLTGTTTAKIASFEKLIVGARSQAAFNAELKDKSAFWPGVAIDGTPEVYAVAHKARTDNLDISTISNFIEQL